MIYVYVHMTCVLKRKDNSVAPLQVDTQQEQGTVEDFWDFPFSVVYIQDELGQYFGHKLHYNSNAEYGIELNS